MSSSERPPHLRSRAAPPGAYEPSTLRMHADQVRALIRELDEPTYAAPEREAPAVLVRGVIDLAEPSEPPTLLYRRPLTRAVLRIDALRPDLEDPRTMHGASYSTPGGLRRPSRIAFTAEAPRDDPSVWQVETGELRNLLGHGGENEWGPTYAEEVFPPAPSLPACATDAPRDAQRARRGAAESPCEDEARDAARLLLMRRMRVRYVVVVGLLVVLAFMIVAAWPKPAPTREARPRVAQVAAPAAEHAGPQVVAETGNAARASADTTTEVSLPAALQAASRALAARADDDASKVNQEALRRAVTQLLAGETREAVVALRALASHEPRVPMLDRVVRLLEAQLAACAARGGDACR